MADADVRRNLRVQFSAGGAKKLQSEVSKVDKGLVRAGKSGTKAFKETESSAVKASKAMEGALGPIDESFKGFDKLNSIIGKFSMLGGMVAMAWGGITWAIEKFNPVAKTAAERMAELEKAAQALTGNLSKYATILSQVNVLQLAYSDDRYAASLKKTALALAKVRAAAKDVTRAEHDMSAARWDAIKANAGMDLQAIASANRAQNSATRRKNAAMASGAASRAELERAKAATEDAAKSVRMLARGYDDLLKSSDGAAKSTEKVTAVVKKSAAVRVDAAAEAAAAEAARFWGAVRWLGELEKARVQGEEMRAMFAEGEERGRREAMAIEREAAASLRENIATQIKMSEASRDAVDSTVNGFEELAAGAEAFGAGATVIQAAQMLASGIKAGADALDYGAESAAAFATGNVVAGLGLAAAAVGKGISAAAYAKGLAELGESSGGVSSSTPATGSAGGASGLTGESSRESSGPVQVNVNFAGRAAGLGRFLVAEINTEAQTRGGNRLDSRAVRR